MAVLYMPNQSLTYSELAAVAPVSTQVTGSELGTLVAQYRRLGRIWHFARKRGQAANPFGMSATARSDYLALVADIRAASLVGSYSDDYAAAAGAATATAHDGLRILYLTDAATSEAAVAEAAALESWIESRG